MKKILEGVKVLDLTRVIAGPLCTQNLADLGATVYKIEKPGEGDDTRRMGPFLKDGNTQSDSNDSALFLAYNRGKKSITIDITTPEGSTIVRQLAQRCDVVVENYKAGNLKKYGLDFESLKPSHPALIYCSITGFGQTGPLAEQPAYDFILQGMAGIMSTCGHPDEIPNGGPMRTAIPIVDMATGQNATIAILAALIQKQITGEGQYIDCAMLDSAVALNGHLAVGYLMTEQNPRRVGNTNPIASPSEVFDCQGGKLIIAVGNNKQFEQFCACIGLPELPQQHEFSTNARRVQHRNALRKVIAEKIEGLQRSELINKFEAIGVPCGPINEISEAFQSPQSIHRQLIVPLKHGNGQNISTLKTPLGIESANTELVAPPTLGADTASVLRDELGIDCQTQSAATSKQTVD